jgi:hypothetical protein
MPLFPRALDGEVATHPALLLPADASASRVVEDCRAAR